MGAKVLGISCVTNMASGLNDRPLTHEEVKETADRVTEKFVALLSRIMELLASEQDKD